MIFSSNRKGEFLEVFSLQVGGEFEKSAYAGVCIVDQTDGCWPLIFYGKGYQKGDKESGNGEEPNRVSGLIMSVKAVNEVFPQVKQVSMEATEWSAALQEKLLSTLPAPQKIVQGQKNDQQG